MVDVFWGVLSVPGVALNVETSIWNVVPSGLRFISEHNVAAIVPLEPSPHSLGKHPGGSFIWALVKPMVERGLETFSPGADVSWELALKSWNDVVEWKGVGAKVDPSGVGGEEGKSVSWPETVVLMPAGNVWLLFLHVGNKVVNIELEGGQGVFLLEVLSENRGPLFAGDVIINVFVGACDVHLLIEDLLSDMNVGLKLLVRLVESMVERTALKVDHTSASLHVVDSSGQSNLGSESMTSEGGHSDLLFVHKSNDVGRDFLKKSLEHTIRGYLRAYQS